MRRTAAMDGVAQAWANHMAEAHQVPPPHNPNNGPQVLAACSSCSGWAENVGYWEADQPDSIWQAWLNSAAHRSNIEDPSGGEYGMGVAYSSDGWLWVVHSFGLY